MDSLPDFPLVATGAPVAMSGLDGLPVPCLILAIEDGGYDVAALRRSRAGREWSVHQTENIDDIMPKLCLPRVDLQRLFELGHIPTHLRRAIREIAGVLDLDVDIESEMLVLDTVSRVALSPGGNAQLAAAAIMDLFSVPASPVSDIAPRYGF